MLYEVENYNQMHELYDKEDIRAIYIRGNAYAILKNYVVTEIDKQGGIKEGNIHIPINKNELRAYAATGNIAEIIVEIPVLILRNGILIPYFQNHMYIKKEIIKYLSTKLLESEVSLLYTNVQHAKPKSRFVVDQQNATPPIAQNKTSLKIKYTPLCSRSCSRNV